MGVIQPIKKALAFLKRVRGNLLWTDVFERRGEKLIHKCGWKRTQELEISQIVRWKMYAEQVFDVFVIDCRDGTEVRWLDRGESLRVLLEGIGKPGENCL